MEPQTSSAFMEYHRQYSDQNTSWAAGIRFSIGAGILFFDTASSRPTLKANLSPTQSAPGALTPGVKWTRREAEHLPPSSVKIKNARNYTSTVPYVFIAWCLSKHRNNFTSHFDCTSNKRVPQKVLSCFPLLYVGWKHFNGYLYLQ
jgi:hypothetical protein